MLNSLIEWSLKNQLLVGVGLVLAILAGVWAVKETRIDAIPDLSDVQVIIFTEFPGQAPQVVEDQVTYPITTKMLAVIRSPTRSRPRCWRCPSPRWCEGTRSSGSLLST